MEDQNHLRRIFDAFVRGDISRRAFVRQTTALGLSAASISFLAERASAAQSTPEATPADAPTRPDIGTENQERGAGPELNIIQWQAPTQLSPHVSTGVKDYLAALPVVEPLIHYLTDAQMYPNLITQVPSQENGLLNENLTEVTLELLPDLLWNDGTPVTAEDIKFTIEWVLDTDNAATSYAQFEAIESVEVVDELTAKVTFSTPNPFWMTPFAGTSSGYLYPKHILEAGPDAHDQFLSSPVGTGP